MLQFNTFHYLLLDEKIFFSFVFCNTYKRLLIINKEHFELITDLPDDLLKKLSLVIKKISKALLKFGNGLNILQNNKKYAGQVIPHVHFHLIPRFENDNVKVEKWVVNEYREGEIEKTASKIKSLLK